MPMRAPNEITPTEEACYEVSLWRNFTYEKHFFKTFEEATEYFEVNTLDDADSIIYVPKGVKP